MAKKTKKTEKKWWDIEIKPRKVNTKEVLSAIRRRKMEMSVEEICLKTRLTKQQVIKALCSNLIPRGMVVRIPREKLKAGYKKPPRGKAKYIMKRDKKGKIPKRIDWIVDKYEDYKIENELY